MAKNDEWCEFCEEKIKQTSVILKGREWEICNHCASLTVSAEVETLKSRNGRNRKGGAA